MGSFLSWCGGWIGYRPRDQSAAHALTLDKWSLNQSSCRGNRVVGRGVQRRVNLETLVGMDLGGESEREVWGNWVSGGCAGNEMGSRMVWQGCGLCSWDLKAGGWRCLDWDRDGILSSCWCSKPYVQMRSSWKGNRV